MLVCLSRCCVQPATYVDPAEGQAKIHDVANEPVVLQRNLQKAGGWHHVHCKNSTWIRGTPLMWIDGRLDAIGEHPTQERPTDDQVGYCYNVLDAAQFFLSYHAVYHRSDFIINEASGSHNTHPSGEISRAARNAAGLVRVAHR